MGKGVGYGKVILFNEHFVVHGIPAIVSAISSRTVAVVEKTRGRGITLEDNRKATPGYKEEKLEQQKDSLERILKAAGIDRQKYSLKIVLEGDLIAASGIGASAASCVAIARAISEEFRLGFSGERINMIAYEGEKGYHGNPSGIDNTAATYGGIIWFQRGEPNVFQKLELKKPFEVVIGNTGIVADTKSAVKGVEKRKDAERKRFMELSREAESLVHNARKAIENYDLKRVGDYMDRNHELLREIGVSCRELDALVGIANENGALGAKLTGGGLGGYMVALTPGKELQEKVAKAIEKEGYQVLRTTVGA